MRQKYLCQMAGQLHKESFKLEIMGEGTRRFGIGLGKTRPWDDGKRRDIAIQKATELKCNSFEHRYVKKEAPVEQPRGERSQACIAETAHLDAPQRHLL